MVRAWNRCLGIPTLTCMALLIASPLMAQILDPCLSTASPVGWPAGIAVCPAGDGRSLSDVGATINLRIRDTNNLPIVNMAPEDVWLAGCVNLTLCNSSESSMADRLTDENGETEMSGTMAAGGSDTGVLVIVQGNVLLFTLNCVDNLCLPFEVRSADMNGDLVVNLVDLSQFAAAFPPNAYSAAADFTFDGIVGLGDVSFLAQHLLHACTP